MIEEQPITARDDAAEPAGDEQHEDAGEHRHPRLEQRRRAVERVADDAGAAVDQAEQDEGHPLERHEQRRTCNRRHSAHGWAG